MQKKKSGVKKCLEICAIKGGGVGPLMANAIKNFHFDFLKPSLNLQGLYFSYLRYLCSFQVSWHNPGFQTPAMEELSRKVLIVKQSSTKPFLT